MSDVPQYKGAIRYFKQIAAFVFAVDNDSVFHQKGRSSV